jgi:hypothetical protein
MDGGCLLDGQKYDKANSAKCSGCSMHAHFHTGLFCVSEKFHNRLVKWEERGEG